MARFRGRAVAVIGHEKGNDTKSRLKHNFGMAMPEGYRKAQRLFDLANRFGVAGDAALRKRTLMIVHLAQLPTQRPRRVEALRRRLRIQQQWELQTNCGHP